MHFGNDNDENMAPHLVEELYGPFGQVVGDSDNQGLTSRTSDQASNRKLEPHALGQENRLYPFKKFQNSQVGRHCQTNEQASHDSEMQI